MSVRDQEGRGGVRQEGRRRLGFTWRTGSGGQAWAAALHPPCRGKGEKREHNTLTLGDRPGTTRRTHTATRRHRIYCQEIRVRGGSPSARPPNPRSPVGRIKAPRAHPALLLFLIHTLPPGDTRARPRSCKARPLPPLGFQLRAAMPTSGLQQTEADPGLWTPSNSPAPQATPGLHRGASEPLEPTHRGLSGPRGGRHGWPSRLRRLCLPGET